MEKCATYIHRNAFSVSAVCFRPGVIRASACQARIPWACLRNSLCPSLRSLGSIGTLRHLHRPMMLFQALPSLLPFQICPSLSVSYAETLRSVVLMSVFSPGLVQVWSRFNPGFRYHYFYSSVIMLNFLKGGYM